MLAQQLYIHFHQAQKNTDSQGKFITFFKHSHSAYVGCISKCTTIRQSLAFILYPDCIHPSILQEKRKEKEKEKEILCWVCSPCFHQQAYGSRTRLSALPKYSKCSNPQKNQVTNHQIARKQTWAAQFTKMRLSMEVVFFWVIFTHLEKRTIK